MTDLKNKITASQLFCLVFCYILAGFRLHGGASVPVTFAVCIFGACACVVCAAAGARFGAFAELCRAALGKCGWLLGGMAIVLLALPFGATLWELSKGGANFYENGKIFVILPVILLICILAASRGFCTIGRFAEICVFPLALLLPLSLLGGGGHAPNFAFLGADLLACFAAVGALPVFLSLYLCLVKPQEQSDFARASGFRPAPVLCGVLAVFAAGAVHLLLVYTGAGSVLSSFLMWFICFGRLFAFSLSACDILAFFKRQREYGHG